MSQTSVKNPVKKIAQKYNLELILLFGSQVSGTVHKESDFDLAYLGEKDLNLKEEAKLIIGLSLIFKSENIDLVNLRKASPLLLYAVTSNCRVIYEKNPLVFSKIRAYAFKKYVESQPLYEEKFRRVLARIKKIKLS